MNTNQDIHNNVMLVELRISQWTARKQDKRVSQSVAAANHVGENVGSYYKSLIDPEQLKSIKQAATEARTAYYKATLPWSDEGPRVLSAAMYFDFMQTMSEHRIKFENLVNAFLGNYAYYREEAKRYLGNLFMEEDYPEPAQLADKFGFNLHVQPLPKANDFRCDLGDEEVERVRNEIEQQTNATMQNTVRAAFDRIREVAERYADRLAEPDNVFRDSMVVGARELVDLMPKLNFTGDPEIERLTNVVRDKLATHEPQALRTNMTTRKETATAARQVVNDIESIFGGGK